jgi:phage shock protein E
MNIFSILGFGNASIKQALKAGAVVIDVRTPHEYDSGHPIDAINIPFDRIAANIERIRKMKRPIIFCCDGGSRSGSSTRLVKARGLKEIYHGGNWENVIRIQKKI